MHGKKRYDSKHLLVHLNQINLDVRLSKSAKSAGTYRDTRIRPPPHVWADKLTLFQSGGRADYAHRIGFSPVSLDSFQRPCYIILQIVQVFYLLRLHLISSLRNTYGKS